MTSLPIEEFGFCLHKGAFTDALTLRYGWTPSQIPIDCACGNTFTVEHALSCPRGGFPTIRHNEIRDVTASLLTEVCHDVMIEPNLQPLTGEALTGAASNTANRIRLHIAENIRRVKVDCTTLRMRLWWMVGKPPLGQDRA